MPPPNGMRIFIQVLVNTALANVTTSFLWFALTFWAYLETRSVLATGVIGGVYMLLIAVFGMLFGTLVDRHRKHRVMVLSAFVTLVAFLIAGALYLAFPESTLVDLGGPWFWVFSGIILLGGRRREPPQHRPLDDGDAARPVERHANANGLVGTVQGVVVHGHQRVQRARDRLPRDGMDARDRDRPHGRGARAPAAHPHPRGRPEATSEKRPSSTCAAASARSPRVSGCSR